MKNGRILPVWQPVALKRFIIPFISAVMGILIPTESYSLLPLKAFNNTIIELTLNRYAMFSSGYNDRGERDTLGMLYPIQRDFFFRKFNYILQIYYFNETNLKSYLESQLRSGIIFSSETIGLGCQYMIANQLALRGAYQINTSASLMTQLMIVLLDNRYLQYPFLRKQYHLSCNISSLQIKFDAKWYPPQPIIGNAGNPEMLDSTGNVQPFLEMAYRSGDQLFNNRMPMGIINAFNFSINSRIFDPSNTLTLLPPTNVTTTQYLKANINSPAQINTDTAMGYSWLHENRCVGRSVYVYNWENLGHSRGLAQGLEVGNSRPFEIIFNTTVVDPNPHEIGLYGFIRSHIVVELAEGGVRISNR